MEDYSSLKKRRHFPSVLQNFQRIGYITKQEYDIYMVYFRHFVLIELFHFVCDQCDVKFKW